MNRIVCIGCLLSVAMVTAHQSADSVLYVRGEIGCVDTSSSSFNSHPDSHQDIHDNESCDVLGTARHPALSCEHLKAVCSQAANGYYFMQSAGLFRKVFCEMDLEGGGWARYGKTDQSTVWNYVDQDEIEITLDIVDPSDVKEMIDLKFNRFMVQTDVVFKLQADDSVNPSKLTTRSLPWLEEGKLYIPDTGNDHTRIEYAAGTVDRVTCIPGRSSMCGQGGGLPAVGGSSERFFFQSLYFGPRATGASIGAHVHANVWARNKYTWNGSFYYVYAK